MQRSILTNTQIQHEIEVAQRARDELNQKMRELRNQLHGLEITERRLGFAISSDQYLLDWRVRADVDSGDALTEIDAIMKTVRGAEGVTLTALDYNTASDTVTLTLTWPDGEAITLTYDRVDHFRAPYSPVGTRVIVFWNDGGYTLRLKRDHQLIGEVVICGSILRIERWT